MTANVSWRVLFNLLGYPMSIPEADEVTISRHAVKGFFKAWSAIPIGAGVSSTAMLFLCLSRMGVLTNMVVGFDDFEFLGETKIATRRECQDNAFYSERKMSRIKLSMSNEPSSLPIANFGTRPNRTQTHSVQNRTWRSYLKFVCKDRFVAFRRLGVFSWWR